MRKMLPSIIVRLIDSIGQMRIFQQNPTPFHWLPASQPLSLRTSFDTLAINPDKWKSSAAIRLTVAKINWLNRRLRWIGDTQVSNDLCIWLRSLPSHWMCCRMLTSYKLNAMQQTMVQCVLWYSPIFRRAEIENVPMSLGIAHFPTLQNLPLLICPQSFAISTKDSSVKWILSWLSSESWTWTFDFTAEKFHFNNWLTLTSFDPDNFRHSMWFTKDSFDMSSCAIEYIECVWSQCSSSSIGPDWWSWEKVIYINILS